ncbi:hypothetical protein LEP1GSC049_1183 [Leptospira kirschneri serovar Cynopteri str. 3522 CT]|nr:hypothetical protein LEP1GSC049_1183 [Leptospira kirschneri serovar Cynopteri str. 3522 CT]
MTIIFLPVGEVLSCRRAGACFSEILVFTTEFVAGFAVHFIFAEK